MRFGERAWISSRSVMGMWGAAAAAVAAAERARKRRREVGMIGGFYVIPNVVREQGGWGVRGRGDLVGGGCGFKRWVAEIAPGATNFTLRADRVPASSGFPAPPDPSLRSG
jgi:hypothetical protein